VIEHRVIPRTDLSGVLEYGLPVAYFQVTPFLPVDEIRTHARRAARDATFPAYWPRIGLYDGGVIAKLCETIDVIGRSLARKKGRLTPVEVAELLAVLLAEGLSQERACDILQAEVSCCSLRSLARRWDWVRVVMGDLIDEGF